MNATPFRGVLLVGPTGSGKTPLGEMLQRRGLWGNDCLHFDFGDNLRRLAARQEPDGWVRREDIEFVRDVLARGALLEDDDFPLAERIVRSFLAAHGATASTRVVLNGLPRHVGQAEAMVPLIDVGAVIELCCSGETVLERITRNTGGDRGGRADDGLSSVRRKLALYAARTAPLIQHYRARGCRVHRLTITAQTTATDAWNTLHGEGATTA